MEELRVEALEFYNNSSTQVKFLAIKFFNHLDSDGDSTISVAELAAFIQGNGFLSRLLIDHRELFAGMDRNGNGNLDFNEFFTFFYVVFASCECDGCGKKFKGQHHLTCASCFAQGSDTFDLCSTCLSSRNYAHQHTEFVPFETLMFQSIARDDDKSKSSNQPEVEETKSDWKHALAYRALETVVAEVAIQTASAACSIM